MRVVVVNHISMDGVIQGPGRPDEDTRNDFPHGGWAFRGADPELTAAMGERIGSDFSWLFGRRSYDDILGYWNEVGGPFKEGLNATTKYVASSSTETRLPWPNSILLNGDVVAEVAELRRRGGGNLVIMGSGQLIRSLLPHGLIDELFLMVHPIVLGSGSRLFGPDEAPREFELVDSRPTPSGVLLATWRSSTTDAES